MLLQLISARFQKELFPKGLNKEPFGDGARSKLKQENGTVSMKIQLTENL